MFNMKDNDFKEEKGGYYRATMTNVPALKDEPQMPPVDEVRAWTLIYYTNDRKGTADDFWSHAGYDISQRFEIKDTLKPGKELKAAVATIIGSATSPEDKVAAIFQFCKEKIKNITFDTSLTEDQKDDIKPNKSTYDTYKKMQGTKVDVNELFASLATAAGFDVRLAFGGDRSEKFFNPAQAHTSFIHFTAIAVMVGNKWQYYSPGSRFVPAGLLDWSEEDTSVLLLNYKDYMKRETPVSTPDQSKALRTGRFKLSEDGTLEGTVRIEYTGHLSNRYKTANYKDSDSKREENLKEEIKATLGTAEVSAITIENATDPEKPFTYIYKVRVPNYAQKTGKRLFLQPGYFEAGSAPVFSSATRKYDIFFRHPWSENDDVEIEIPKGYALDTPDLPGELSDAQKVSGLAIQLSFDKSTSVLKYTRKFHFGGGGYVLFAVAAYPQIKNLFDSFNKVDTYSVTFKQN